MGNHLLKIGNGSVLAIVVFFIAAFSTQLFAYETASSFRYPLDSGGWYLSQDFGVWNDSFGGYHLGEDCAVNDGTELPVYAPANGIVKHNSSRTSYGRVVIIEHRLPDGNYVCSVHGHMRSADIISVGTEVSKGDLIGYLSDDYNENGGYSFTHLHFGIRTGAYSSTWVYSGYGTSTSGWYDPGDYVDSQNAGITDVLGSIPFYETFNGSTIGNASGITYTSTPKGQGALFQKDNESRIEYPFSMGFPNQGTIEYLIKVDRGYQYSDYTFSYSDHAVIFDTGSMDVWWPGAMWFSVYNNGGLSLATSTDYAIAEASHTLSAQDTPFRFNQWHTIGFSYGSHGQYIMLDGKVVASDTSYTESMNTCGNFSAPVNNPTVGESISSFWRNNQYDISFEGVIDTLRISDTQKDWKLNNENIVIDDDFKGYPLILSNTSPDHTIQTDSQATVYGTAFPNDITIVSGAKAELINFPGSNKIEFQSDSNLFTVFRSGTAVTFEGTDGTVLKIPATGSVQTVAFADRAPLTLSIYNKQVMLDDQVVTTTPASIDGGSEESKDCGAFIAPGVWKEFDCYNLAAIGKISGADPLTPSWELIGGYWQWGRKGPDQTKHDWYKIATEHFAPGPSGGGSAVEDANAGSIIFWDTINAPNGSWSDSSKTANDPCPEGYRVPTRAQWDAFVDNNTQSKVGSWSSSATNYTSALYLGSDLMLPAAGGRSSLSGALGSRGRSGSYWSSSESSILTAWYLNFLSGDAKTYTLNRRYGFSVRCVAE